MAERPVLVGLIPQVVVLDAGDQVSWISDAGNLRVEFDVNRCPFSSNVFQARVHRAFTKPPQPDRDISRCLATIGGSAGCSPYSTGN